MNTRRSILLLLFALGLPAAHAQLTIPGDGSDGVFAPVANIEVDLSQAVTGAWDANNTANAGKGVYDPSKWAVTFKYASVNIPAGVTVTFKNHPSRAPVVWLVQGSALINGSINLQGKIGTGDSSLRLIPSEPGPGGSRGGVATPAGWSTGFGIGGTGSNGQYSGIYGNQKILPLIGGSGGSGEYLGNSGSAGGGAILIASSSDITLSGSILSRHSNMGNAHGGSSGAVRLIATNVLGTGEVNVLGGIDGGNGRIRIETLSLASTIRTFPETIAVTPGNIPEIWPPATAPTIAIFSIDGVTAPTEPLAPFVNGADTQISKNSAVSVVVKTRNFPIQGNVQVRAMGKTNGTATWHTLTYASGDFNEALWSKSITFPAGFSALQARATMP